MIFANPRSLEDLRNQQFVMSRREFARFLGVTEQTYRRLLDRDPQVENPTRRRVAERLALPPQLIIELVPPPSADYITALTASINEANKHGWYAYDPATGRIADQPTTIECPPELDDQA
jgi:hypothetical protein